MNKILSANRERERVKLAANFWLDNKNRAVYFLRQFSVFWPGRAGARGDVLMLSGKKIDFFFKIKYN